MRKSLHKKTWVQSRILFLVCWTSEHKHVHQEKVNMFKEKLYSTKDFTFIMQLCIYIMMKL